MIYGTLCPIKTEHMTNLQKLTYRNKIKRYKYFKYYFIPHRNKVLRIRDYFIYFSVAVTINVDII